MLATGLSTSIAGGCSGATAAAAMDCFEAVFGNGTLRRFLEACTRIHVTDSFIFEKQTGTEVLIIRNFSYACIALSTGIVPKLREVHKLY